MLVTNKPLNILIGIDLSEMDAYLFNYIHTLEEVQILKRFFFYII